MLFSQAQDMVEMAMIFSLVDAAQTWISENSQEKAVNEEGIVEEDVEDNEQGVSDAELFATTKTTGGRWHFVIGLVVSTCIIRNT